MCIPAVILVIFSTFCYIAPVTFAAPRDERQMFNSSSEVCYDDLWYSTFGPTPQERAERKGYTAETHEVETEDGYILQVHRITGSEVSPKADNKTVVLLVHGLLDCSATWVMGSTNKSLGFILADRGYDVWMGNVRGNRYSRQHKRMTTNEKQYWMFSWHEIGLFDLPAMIDHILEETKQKKLIYVGHSQGCTSFFVMASMRPEYQKKIEAMFALAPAVFMSHATLPLMRILAPMANQIKVDTTLKKIAQQNILHSEPNNFALAIFRIGKSNEDIEEMGDQIGLYEFMPTDNFIQQMAKKACSDNSTIKDLCLKALVVLISPGEKLLNQTLISEAAQYAPAGASSRQFVHYAQLIKSGRFCQYDHGVIENRQRYGSNIPPSYPLRNIKIPIYLHYSSNDAFVNVIDLYKLYRRLPNRQKFLVPEPSFTHIDFVWSKPMDTLLYNTLLSLMEKHTHAYNASKISRSKF